MSTTSFPDADLDLAVVMVHIVCCDANVGLCGQVLPGGDHYVEAGATCPLCELAEQLGGPCGAPGCDVGVDEVFAQLEDFAPLGRCRICGCTDDECCPGGCRWVADDLCSACVPGGGPGGDGGPPPADLPLDDPRLVMAGHG